MGLAFFQTVTCLSLATSAATMKESRITGLSLAVEEPLVSHRVLLNFFDDLLQLQVLSR
jgi:hypothetical protein